MKKFLPIIALITFAAAPGTAPGQVIDHAYQYQACMTLAREAPQEAFETALTWRGLGGGDAAEHCVAVALIGLGQHTKAAARLEALARKTKQGGASGPCRPGVDSGGPGHEGGKRSDGGAETDPFGQRPDG